MQPAARLALDCLDRVHELIPAVLDGMSPQDAAWRPDPGANSVGWLVWHLLRIEDDHVAGIGDREQVWLAHGWQQRLGLPYKPSATGFGMSAGDVGRFALADVAALTGYAAEVHSLAGDVLGGLSADDLERVIDTNWDPPVTVAVRLVSVVVEVAQHVGQAAYVRGLRERSNGVESGWRGYPT